MIDLNPLGLFRSPFKFFFYFLSCTILCSLVAKCVTQIRGKSWSWTSFFHSWGWNEKMHCILINNNKLKQVKFIQKFNAIYHFVGRWWGVRFLRLLLLLISLVRETFFCVLFKWISHRQGKKAHRKYHLLKSYDYDIIYSPVFVAIYVANRRKFVLT